MAKVLISIREDFLQMVDELASIEHRSRSELIRQALRDYAKQMKMTSISAETIENLLLDDDE